MSDEGDAIDLRALELGGGGQAVADLVGAGFLALVGGSELWIDLDGGDGIDSNTGTADDVLLLTFNDGGGGFDLATDVLV